MGRGRTYETAEQALQATNDFYQQNEGFNYDLGKVVTWIRENVKVPNSGRVLDLCCGDGIWSKGFHTLNPGLELFGIDVSAGGIDVARKNIPSDEDHFIVGDAESDPIFPDIQFDLIFARGPGLFNQHDMSRPGTVRVLEAWHALLSDNGAFYSIFASTPDRIGTYTPAEDVVLPYNMAPRTTNSVEFSGGKYHHSIESFHAPFWKGNNIKIKSYKFQNRQHILVSEKDEII